MSTTTPATPAATATGIPATGVAGKNTIAEGVVADDVYVQLVRSPDEGVAEFLDLARVKPNTLGNTRMLKILTPIDGEAEAR